ncbi:MAG TPA: WD40 repeat domain-containing protein, partial [Gemmataceae bacterium]|nr:WD40 repeat domain-containing protein [Gemmataceae bacterium]
MIRRFVVSLIVAAPVCLLVVFGPPRPAVPGVPDSNFGLPNADTPIVAIRGQPLAEHEEPLPPGARVRFGSTRFRHPKGLDRWQVQIAGPYFLTQDQGVLTLTDRSTGRRVWHQAIGRRIDPMGRRRDDLDDVEARPDGLIVEWKSGSVANNRIVGRVSEAVADPAQPIRLVTALRFPDGAENESVEGVFFPEDLSEIWVLADGIHAFDVRSGRHLRHVRTKNRILAMDRRGTRFLTSSQYDPRFRAESIIEIGSFRVPTYSFRPRSPSESASGGKRRLGRFVRDGRPEGATGTLTLIVANARTGESIFATTIPDVSRQEASHLDLSPDGRYLSYEADSCLTVFDIDRARLALELDTWEGDWKERHQLISESWFSDDGSRFTVAGSEIGEIQFDLATGLEVSPQGERPMKSDYWFGLVRRNPVVSEEGVLHRPSKEPTPPGYARIALAHSAERRLIVIGDAAGRLDVWHQDGRLVRSLRTAEKAISAAAFSQNGELLAACDHDHVLRIWTVQDWRECDRFE